MLGPVLIGMLAAVIGVAPRFVRYLAPGLRWQEPVFLLGVTLVAVLIQRQLLDRRPGHRGYDGLADLFIHIHSPSNPDSSFRWFLRGLVSFLLSIFGAKAGAEGAAVEIAHAAAIQTRPRSSRWFEQRRRTDAAVALAAGISASFSAPFAAVLLPIELGIGGRTLSAVLASLTAFLSMRFLLTLVPADTFDLSGLLFGFNLVGWHEWAAIGLITVAGGIAGAGIIRFVRYAQESLVALVPQQPWVRILIGGLLMFGVAVAFPPSNFPSWMLTEDVLWSRRDAVQVALLFFAELISIALLLSAFGTVGLFWPLFTLGSCFGFLMNHHVAHSSFPAMAGLAGGAALWGAVLGTPLAGAVMAFELTQNINVLLPCLVAAIGARAVRALILPRGLVDKDLEARGVSLVEGRSANVLDSVTVAEAMVTDFESVDEKDPVNELKVLLAHSKYPFLAVRGSQGQYVGLLTIDMVQEAWRAHEGEPSASNAPLSKLLEAKDLLYRGGFKTDTVRPGDPLSVTAGMFEEVPVVPVLSPDKKVIGLLFVHNVRLAYDREVARRSLMLHRPSER